MILKGRLAAIGAAVVSPVAFASVLCEALTGTRPFPGPTVWLAKR